LREDEAFVERAWPKESQSKAVMFNNLPNGQHDHKYATLDNMRRGGQQYPALQSYQNGSRDASHGAEQPGLGYMPQAPLDYDRSFQRDERYNRDALPQDFAPRDTYQLHKTRTSQQLVARPRSGFSNYTSQTNGTHDTAQTNGTFRTQHVPSRGPPRFNLPKPIGRRSTINGDEDGDFDIPGYNTRSSRRVESIADYVRPTGDSRSGSTSSQTLTRISSDTARGPPRQTPYTLAQAIMKGETEDPDDRAKLHRKYTTPSKLSMPAMGPTRFKDSTMFSHAEPPPFTGAPAQETTQLVRSGIGPVKDIIPPLWLSTVMQGMCNPTMEELLDDIPITELCRLVAPSTAGVIKIREIPYATPRAEMISFLGRNAQILRQPEASPYHAVHILLERESGKTMDCYIEVASPDEAAFVVRAFQKRVQAGRPPKVGERTVEVVYSSQDELLSELFPRAKHVQWKDGWPIVDLSPRLYYENEMAAGFQGFIHPEEFVMLLKHANAKERSPFASKSPTRTYEALITIMHKYPWYAPKYIPVHERDRIYDCVLKLMSNLVRAIKESNGQYGPFDLSPPLLQEMVTAALVCPGFSEAQKAKIVGYLQLDGFGEMASGAYTHVYLGGNHALAPFWPFAALSVIPGADIELVKVSCLCIYFKLFDFR
jgi:hypothetical protein